MNLTRFTKILLLVFFAPVLLIAQQNPGSKVYNAKITFQDTLINTGNKFIIQFTDILTLDDKIILKLRVEKYEDLIGIQIPLNLDEDVFSLEGITFINGFNPWYHYSAERQTLMIMDYATDGITPININDGEICKITLKVKITKNIRIK